MASFRNNFQDQLLWSQAAIRKPYWQDFQQLVRERSFGFLHKDTAKNVRSSALIQEVLF
jgi:hypothetical protein